MQLFGQCRCREVLFHIEEASDSSADLRDSRRRSGRIFDFIELFYNSQRRHSHVGGVSPRQFAADYFERLQGV